VPKSDKAEDLVASLMLDWVRGNWSYSYQETPHVMQELSSLFEAQNCLGFVLSEETEHSDPLPILSLEIEGDMQASTLLAISGFYRHATLALRSCLALAFASIWFSFNRTEFTRWMNREANAPFQHDGIMRRKSLAELMRKDPRLKMVESQFNLIENSMKMHEELSEFVHARGKNVMDTYLRADSVPHFYPEHLKSWLGRLHMVFETWLILVFARYPELLQMTRHPGEKEKALCVLSGDVRTKLESLR
jgi:hypothetical protein